VCPLCITSAVLSAAGAGSAAGVAAAVAVKWRALRGWLKTGAANL
jgi:hypothetical protein